MKKLLILASIVLVAAGCASKTAQNNSVSQSPVPNNRQPQNIPLFTVSRSSTINSVLQQVMKAQNVAAASLIDCSKVSASEFSEIGTAVLSLLGSNSGSAAGAGKAYLGCGNSAGQVALRLNTNAGEYLTDSTGAALYFFSNDSDGTSHCNGGCASVWPPFAAKGSSGNSNLSVITRSDGSSQYAWKGMPLYFYSGDKSPGDTNGTSVPNWQIARP